MFTLHIPPTIKPANATTLGFITKNAHLTPSEAALAAPRNTQIDILFAINQIAGKQIAQQKLPNWASCNEVIYPAHISMEQCSSQATAQYKANLAHNLLKKMHKQESPHILVDLTGGFGVDCTIMSQFFDSALCIEQQPELSSIAQHNMHALHITNVQCYNTNSLEALNAIPQATMIYIDPARRNTQGARTYAIEDCTPNVLNIKNQLLQKSAIVLVKLSPMLDWHKTVSDLKGNVAEVHIVAHKNECKELLLVLNNNLHTQLLVHCVNDTQHTTFTATYDIPTNQVSVTLEESHDTKQQHPKHLLPLQNWKMWAHYVYEPNAAIMKAGCFTTLGQQYGMQQISSNSHVYIADTYYPDFPGKIWKIEKIFSMNKQEIKRSLNDITHANIITRNFPMSAESLRKRLKIQNGGQTRIIATTDSSKEHVLIRATAAVSQA